MATKKCALTLDNLKGLDLGVVEAIFNRACLAVAADLESRPGCKTKRSIDLCLEFVPVVTDQGCLDSAKMRISCKTKLPAQITKTYELKSTETGLEFNPTFPESIDQLPLKGFDVDVKTSVEEVKRPLK